MKQLLVLVMLLCVALDTAFAAPAGYSTDKGTVSFLHYNLISGPDFTFPPEALSKKLSGTGFFLMRLRPDGTVESVTKKMSSGYSLLDDHITRVLKAYRFRPGTKQPIQWLVGFIYPKTVIVKLNPVKEPGSSASPNKIIFGQKVR